MADLVGVKTLSEWTPKLWAEASDDAPHLLGATRQPSAGSQACPRPRGGSDSLDPAVRSESCCLHRSRSADQASRRGSNLFTTLTEFKSAVDLCQLRA